MTHNMTKQILLFTFSTILFFTFSCKSQKSKTSNNETQPKENQVIKTESTQNQGNYRFIVEFYSIGEGTDGKAKEKFNSFIENYQPKPDFEKYLWGREGESDYCFQLKNMNESDQKKFVEEAKKLLSDSKLVHFSENSPCLHKRE